MFQARCGPRAPRQLRGARRIARRARKCAAPRAPSPRPPSRRPPVASAAAPPHPARCSSRRRTGTRSGRAPSSCSRHRPRLLHPVQVRARRAPAAPPPPLAAPRLTDAPAPAFRAMDFVRRKRAVVDYVRQISVYRCRMLRDTRQGPHETHTRRVQEGQTRARPHWAAARDTSGRAPFSRAVLGTRGCAPPHSHAEVEDVRLGESLLSPLGVHPPWSRKSPEGSS